MISVLAAILIPALQAVRNRSKVTQEVSNLRQIGVGLSLYISDNQGSYPFINMDPKEMNNPDALPDGYWNTQLAEYLPHQVAMDDQASVFQSPLIDKEHRHPISDYGANYLIFLDGNPGNPGRATQRLKSVSIPEPARKAAVMTAWARPAGDREGNWVASWLVEYSYAHTGSANNMPHPRINSLPSASASVSSMTGEVGVLFCDGHVDTIEWAKFHENRKEYLLIE